MKKILFMLLAVMGVFSSCSNKVDDLYNPDMTAALKNAQYNRAFLSQFGNIDPYHTWGFNNLGSRASDTDSNHWSDNWYTPDNITEDERAAVLAEFSKVRKDAVNTIIIDAENYWIQQVYKGTSTYVDANGNTVNNGDPVSNKMDYLLAYNSGSSDCISIYPEWNNYQAVKTDYEHVNNFNQGNNTAVNTRQEGNEVLETYYGTTLMINMAECSDATKQFGYTNSIDGKIHNEYIILEIDGSYYIGFDFYANGSSADKQIERDWIFNDWIVKITEGVDINTPIEKVLSTSRIIAEDLGEIGDFDFNDVVFDVELVEVVKGTQVIENYANITLLAAGGTLPLYIGAHEVHAEFGVETDVMVNTGMGESKDPVKFKLDKCTSPADIQISVRDGGKEYILNSNVGQAPMKICVTTNFEWPAERQNIKDKYPKFADYVNDQSVTWY